MHAKIILVLISIKMTALLAVPQSLQSILFEQGIEPAVGVTIDEFHDYPTDDTLEVVTEYPWDDNDYLFNDTYYHTYDHFYGYFFNFSYFDNYPDYAIDFNYTDYIDYDFNNTDYVDLGFNYYDYTFDYGFNGTDYYNYGDSCYDENSQCAWWAEIGECTVNPMYMLISCAQSCKSCGTKYEDIPPVKQDCLDKSSKCEEWAIHGKCGSNYMKFFCPAVCQEDCIADE